MTAHDPLLIEAHRVNEAAKAAARLDVMKHRAIIDGTAWGMLLLLQDEILATAGKLRNARRAGIADAVRSHTVALRSLNDVRRKMRGKYPNAKPFWRSEYQAARDADAVIGEIVETLK